MTARTDGTALRVARAIEAVRFGIAELALLEPEVPAEVAAFLATLRRYLGAWPARAARP